MRTEKDADGIEDDFWARSVPIGSKLSLSPLEEGLAVAWDEWSLAGVYIASGVVNTPGDMTMYPVEDVVKIISAHINETGQDNE